MSSINTNASAMTALQTLAATNKSLATTQNRISTGYRVSEAADNAAYWSIATTMRSDNKALSTVQDALGMGAAQVDIAYTAMDSTKDILDEIKSKLVAAKQPSVDKSKIQSEISQLQQQIQGIASAASFSGSNWLSVDSSASGYVDPEKVVASFSRGSDGSVSIGTINIDKSGIALFDANSASTAGGLLEGTAGTATSAAFAWTAGDMDAGGNLSFAITVDGTVQNVDVTVADPAAFTLDDVITGLNEGLQGAHATAGAGNTIVFTSHSLGGSSSIAIGAVTATLSGGGASTATTGIAAGTATAGTENGGGVLGIDISSASAAEIDAYIAQVDTMLADVTTAASDLGAVKSRIDMQKDFASKLMDAVDRGIGQLVDADMEGESARLSALQVQQQLGIQALSIANSNAQNILSLFR